MPIIQSDDNSCRFQGYDVDTLMREMSSLTKLMTKRVRLKSCCLCAALPIRRDTEFKKTMKGFSSKTLATRLKELERNGILNRQAFNEIPPREEYRLTTKGQELRVHL